MNVGSLTLLIWGIWDFLYQRCTRLQYVEKEKNIFRIVLLRYHGETLTTSDNKQICSGDLILRLHIHNYFFARRCKGVQDEVQSVLLLRKMVMESLPQLAQFLQSLPQAEQIKGVVGTTLLCKGVQQLGFSISNAPDSWFFRYKRWYLRQMLMFTHPQGWKRMKQAKQMQHLKRVYMSKEQLLERYLQTS